MRLLADCVDKTSFAVPEEESRYVLNGALLKLKPDGVTMVATDGHRLALVERKAQIPNGFNAQYVLEFLRAVGGATSVRMQVKDGENAAGFRPTGDDGEHYRYVLMPLRL